MPWKRCKEPGWCPDAKTRPLHLPPGPKVKEEMRHENHLTHCFRNCCRGVFFCLRHGRRRQDGKGRSRFYSEGSIGRRAFALTVQGKIRGSRVGEFRMPIRQEALFEWGHAVVAAKIHGRGGCLAFHLLLGSRETGLPEAEERRKKNRKEQIFRHGLPSGRGGQGRQAFRCKDNTPYVCRRSQWSSGLPRRHRQHTIL